MRRLVKPALIAVLILTAGIFVKGSITQPSIGGWLSAGSMTEARSSAASARLQDGRILITGGDNGSGPIASAEFFDTTGTFVAAPPMSIPRSAHSLTVLADGRILAAGGSTGAAATNAAEIFDSATNAWTPVAGGMIQARSNHTASSLADGRVLFAGGDNAGAPVAVLEIFDPVVGSFSSVGVMSAPRMSFASAVLADGRVLLIGGSNGTVPLATTEIFDPTSNSISAGPALSAHRMAHSATTLLDGRVLVAGGTTVVSNPDGSTINTDLASAEIYDPATGNFAVSTSSLAAPRRDHAAFLLPNNNSVLIVGGTSAGAEVATAEMFLPSTVTFVATGSPTAARQHATGTALEPDGILFLAGGSNSTGTLATSELYGFATVKTDKADYAPGEIVTITGSGWQPGETVTLTLVESPFIDTHPVMTAVADSTGKIVNNQFSPDQYDLSIRFYLTAVGSLSGSQAQNTFTDGNATSVSGTVRSSAAGNPAISGATITCTGGCNNSPAATTTSGTTGVYVFDSTTTKLSFNTNGPVTVTLTASAPGFNSATLSFSVSNGDNLTGKDFTLTPSVSGTTTTVTPSPNPSSYGSSVTFTATVVRSSGTNTPSGTVSIKEGSTTICITGNLSGSGGTATASCAVSTMSVTGSPHSITAVYGGDTNFTGSTSPSISQTVNPAPVTVTFTAADKIYDGTNTATVSNCVIATGKVGSDDVTCSVANGTFASANASASAQTVSATVTLGGVKAGNYTLGANTTATTTARINPKPVTPAITADNKDYDGTTTATIQCALTGVLSAETANVNCSGTGNFADANAGVGKTVTSNNLALGGSASGNYILSSTTATTTATINKATPTVTVSFATSPITYDGNSHAATTTVTGVGGADLTTGHGTVAVTYTPGPNAPVNAGSYSASAHFTSTDGNYNDASSTVAASLTINKTDATVVITPYSGTYDANPHSLTGTAKGVGGVDLSAGLNFGASFTNVPGGTATWTFTGGTNYNDQTGTGSVTISKADATVVITPYSGTYDANPHSLTGTAKGVGGVDLSAGLNFGASFTNVPGGTATWTFTGGTNYNGQTGTGSVTISKATPLVTVSFPLGIVTYDANSHPAGAAVSGVGGVNLSGHGALSVTYTPGVNIVPVNAGNYVASAHFASTDGNYNDGDSAASASLLINKATPTVTVTGGSFIYDGNTHPATATATGISSITVAGSFVFTYTPPGTTAVPVNPGSYTVGAEFTSGNPNYGNTSGSATITIGYGICSASVGAGGVILPPINSDGTSVYQRKGGSTIPVKFRVCSASGASISNPAAVFSGTGGNLTMLSAVRGTITNINELDGTDIPDVAFRWDGQQWIFNMATNNLTSGSTYAFRINLAYAPASITFVVGVK
jgi:hypothetical protein